MSPKGTSHRKSGVPIRAVSVSFNPALMMIDVPIYDASYKKVPVTPHGHVDLRTRVMMGPNVGAVGV